MGKFIKRVLFGAVAAWVVKFLRDKKTEWSMRPSADIRRDVVTNLPSAMDPATREKVADKVVEVVKGEPPVEPDEAPLAQHLTSPPPPDLPDEPDMRR